MSYRNKVKPCNCGSKDIEIRSSGIKGRYFLVCLSCFIFAPDAKGREKAIEAWDTRFSG